MPSVNSLSTERLSRLLGTPRCPRILDVRVPEDVEADPLLIPGSVRLPHTKAAECAAMFPDRSVVVVCAKGRKLSEGVAAWLRHGGVVAEILEGGMEAWAASGQPRVPLEKIPPRDRHGRTIWVTRSRPKIDRIACPWLIRRFVDPDAVFLFVAPSEVTAVAERFDATPFDVEDVFWTHRDELCTFDTMLAGFGLDSEPLRRLATIVRGADTARPDLAPEVAGLLAVSLGLSRVFADDLEQLEAGLTLYDALYRWARDATDETHTWPHQRRSVR